MWLHTHSWSRLTLYAPNDVDNSKMNNCMFTKPHNSFLEICWADGNSVMQNIMVLQLSVFEWSWMGFSCKHLNGWSSHWSCIRRYGVATFSNKEKINIVERNTELNVKLAQVLSLQRHFKSTRLFLHCFPADDNETFPTPCTHYTNCNIPIDQKVYMRHNVDELYNMALSPRHKNCSVVSLIDENECCTQSQSAFTKGGGRHKCMCYHAN